MNKKNTFITFIISWLILFIGATEWVNVFDKSSFFKQIIEKLIAGLDAGSAVALAILAGFAFKHAQNDDHWISVKILYPSGRIVTIPNAFQREDCSRSEVQGLLGSVHTKPSRYKVAHIQTNDFLLAIKHIKESNEVVLNIPITEDDDLSEPKEYRTTDMAEGQVPVFWNISNHPSESEWSEKQIRATRELVPDALLIDQTFPQVDPQWTCQEVYEHAQKLIDTWFSEVDTQYRVKAAMVAGEPVMCQALVKGLEARDIPCYSATTIRNTVNENGEKRSQFEFVQFRAFNHQQNM